MSRLNAKPEIIDVNVKESLETLVQLLLPDETPMDALKRLKTGSSAVSRNVLGRKLKKEKEKDTSNDVAMGEGGSRRKELPGQQVCELVSSIISSVFRISRSI